MNKKVLITGGNKGIGLETTKILVANGYEVYVIARNFKGFEFASNEFVHSIEFDISDIAGIPKLVEHIGSIDILINNAGIMNSLPFDEYPDKDMERLMNINLYAPIKFIECVSSYMCQQGYGRIVNNSSIAGQIGHPDIWYGISKAGIINATKSFAKLLAPKGVVINAVAPSPVNTDMLHVIPDERKEFLLEATYSNRFAKADEVAQTIYWLAAESPAYINGVCIDINNGAFPR